MSKAEREFVRLEKLLPQIAFHSSSDVAQRFHSRMPVASLKNTLAESMTGSELTDAIRQWRGVVSLIDMNRESAKTELTARSTTGGSSQSEAETVPKTLTYT